MKYILVDDDRRENAIDHLLGLDLKKPVEVHIKDYKRNRTKSQNDTLWMWYKPIAEHFGYTPTELHEVMKVRFLGTVEYKVDGQLLIKPKSTTKLSTKEMAEFLTKVQMLAVTNNIRIPMPDDLKFVMFQEK